MGVWRVAVISTSPGIEHTKHSRSARQACGQATLGTAKLYLKLMRTRTVNSCRGSGHSQIIVFLTMTAGGLPGEAFLTVTVAVCIFFHQITYSELHLQGTTRQTTKYAAILIGEEQIK